MFQLLELHIILYEFLQPIFEPHITYKNTIWQTDVRLTKLELIYV